MTVVTGIAIAFLFPLVFQIVTKALLFLHCTLCDRYHISTGFGLEFVSARDIFHAAVKKALEKEQWIVTHDPLIVKFGKDKVSIDLGAERIIAAEKAGEKIAIEIKSFLNESELYDYHAALGQFLNYRLALQFSEPDRTLYLAISLETYRSLFSRDLTRASVQQYQVKLIVYDPINEVIVQWQN
ncbi:XisH family protein [Aerosakkonema sp. BLCC-F2]